MYNMAGYIYVTVDSPTSSAVEEEAEIGMVRTVRMVPGTERYSTRNGQLGLANHVASTLDSTCVCLRHKGHLQLHRRPTGK